ncbi:hypothetical protein T06_2692 [Trichinella sp. T6]|nr:hypothetical protein T06_2692 [Trichinella sp. T6]
MIITLADLKCWLSVNEIRNILVGVTHPLERCGQDTGRAKTRQTPPRKIAATDNRVPKTGSCALTEKGAKQPLRSSTLDAMRSSWRLETGPSWRLVPGGIKIALSEEGSLLAHLCRWNPPHAINSYSWTASVFASSNDSQDVAKSSTGASQPETRHCKSVLAYPLSLVPPEISTCVPILSADLDLCIHLLNVRLQPYSLSGGQPPTGWSGWWVLLPAGRSTKFLRSALSRRIQRGTFVLRLLPCRPQRVGDTRSASAAGTLVSVQPSRV